MLFNSVDYLIFFPVTLLLFYLFPRRFRYICLVCSNFYFYMCWDIKYGLILFYITAISYIATLIITLSEKKGKKILLLTASILLCLGVLFVYKYYDFFIYNINKFSEILRLNIKISDLQLILPVGISFYIFQALGYLIDVYRGKIKPEKNFLKYVAFISFFPNLLSGPIERADNLLKQISEGVSGSIEKIKNGMLLIAWGLFLKLVLSNNIAPVVEIVFENDDAYRGIEIIIATVLFGFQIYCDFAGYSYMAIGSAKIMGFELNDNFKAPYLSGSAAEFWRRWHISLTSWFRDYLYIPLGGNRKGKLRKYINTIIVFTTSGIWHGASWSFVFWGFLNGIFIVFGEASSNFRNRLRIRCKINKNKLLYRCISCLLTFALIDFAWIFFRANSFSQGLRMIKKIFLELRLDYLISGEVFSELGGIELFILIFMGLILLFIVDMLQYKNINVSDKIFALNPLLRWSIYLGLLFTIIIFGVYGYSYEQTEFIYFQF